MQKNFLLVVLLPLLVACSDEKDGASDAGEDNGLNEADATSCETACTYYADVCGEEQDCALKCELMESQYNIETCGTELEAFYACVRQLPQEADSCRIPDFSALSPADCGEEKDAVFLCNLTEGEPCVENPLQDSDCAALGKLPKAMTCMSEEDTPEGCVPMLSNGAVLGGYCCPM